VVAWGELHGLSSDSWVAPVLSPPSNFGGRAGARCSGSLAPGGRRREIWAAVCRGSHHGCSDFLETALTGRRGHVWRRNPDSHHHSDRRKVPKRTTLVNCGRDSSRARLLADNRCLYICSSTEVKIGKEDGRKRMFESMRVRMVMSIIGHPSYASHTKAKTHALGMVVRPQQHLGSHIDAATIF